MAEIDPLDEDPFEDDRDDIAEHSPDEEGLQYSGSSVDGPADDFSTADLEEAYLRALDAMESAEWAVPDQAGDDESAEIESDSALETANERPPSVTMGDVIPGTEIAGANFLGNAASSPEPHNAASGVCSDGELSLPTVAKSPVDPTPAAPAKPARVIEACLFVGGQPLSAKKLANVLDGNNDPADIEVLIDELNSEYATQGRPYEIRLGDGGYRLTLRSEFDAVRSRVYGVGPRDVKLSQDVLEVLALVAYQQPITHAAVEAAKPNSANLLRQLLRRELISLTRIDQSRNGVEYRTTTRFLQLFGLGQLSELPRPEDLSIR